MGQKQELNPEIRLTGLSCSFEGAPFQSLQGYCSQIQDPTTLFLNQSLKSKDKRLREETERDHYRVSLPKYSVCRIKKKENKNSQG